MTRPVWLITGCSSGIGRALAQAVLAHGHRAVVTARDPATLAAFGEAFPETALLAALDVTVPAQIAAVVRGAEERFGGVDVLVNNAGVGYLAAIEEGEDLAIRAMFETNVFGVAATIRAVLPGMRARGRGTIVNVSSIAGLLSNPALGYYSASKFAVEGLTEALWHEVEPLGLKVLLVEPGGFRTGITGRTRRSPQLAAYAGTAGALREAVDAGADTMPGDPARAAQVILHAVEAEGMPHRLLLGSDAYDGATAKIDALRREYGARESLSRSTDFPAT